MSMLGHPGISLAPVLPRRRVSGLVRADVPVLIGFATRGPLMAPVRIESLRQFEAIFGEPMAGTYLHDATKGFFETGGQVAYVLRVAGPGARVASVAIAPWWRARARTALSALGPVGQNSQDGTEGLPWFEDLRRTWGLSLPDPGVWANDLLITLTRQARTRVPAQVVGPDRLSPRSMAGQTLHGLVQLPDSGQVARIVRVDAARGDIQLGADHKLAIGTWVSVETVTFDLTVTQRGQRVEAYADLHPVPAHPGSFASRLNRQSPNVSLDFTGPDETPDRPVDWTDQTLWPAGGTFALTGGTADLTAMSGQTWLDAIAAQARVDEIALVALPDLVRQPALPRPPLQPARLLGARCDLPVAAPKGAIAGRVLDGATGRPVPDCQVLAAGTGNLVLTDSDGFFLIEGLDLALIDLRFAADGYERAESFAQATTAAQKFRPKPATLPLSDPALTTIRLIALDDIRALDPAEVVVIQRSLPGLMGDYRIAVIDPPAPGLTPDALLEWRAQLGQDARLFPVAPWVVVENGLMTALPPSGHVCGAFAAAELAQGVHAAPANLPLRHAKLLTADFDEAALAAFHAEGVNPLRALRGQGLRLMGSRTASGSHDWQQVSVRRLFDTIEKTLAGRLAWAVFEPNGAATRAILKFTVEQFLETLRRQGMFAGSTQAGAFGVACDGGNNPAAATARGELVIDIAIAPTKPYEFIRFSLTAQADAIEVTETP